VPNASCLSCNSITGKRESWYQNQTIGDLKTLLRFPARKGAIRRGKVRIYDGSKRVSVPATDAPAYLTHPVFPQPEVIRGAPWDTEVLMRRTVINPRAGAKLTEAYGQFASHPVQFNAISFGLMLAKIAHSFAVAITPGVSLARMTLTLRNSFKRAPIDFLPGSLAEHQTLPKVRRHFFMRSHAKPLRSETGSF
jgi:hypothetical protein